MSTLTAPGSVFFVPPTYPSLQAVNIAELESYYAPPSPIAPSVQPSTDPNVYMNDPNYLKGLNKQFFEQFLVVVPNLHSFDSYKFGLETWANVNYRKGALPPPPVYVALDQAKFDGWWLRYCASWNAGVDAPPPDFIVTLPPITPAPVIVAPAAPTSGSPIGAANGLNIFQSSPNDSLQRFADQAVYVDQTGTYIKHIYITPFGTTIFWNKVA